MSAEFKNPFLKKIPTELFPQIELKEEYPLPKLCFERKNPKICFFSNFAASKPRISITFVSIRPVVDHGRLWGQNQYF